MDAVYDAGTCLNCGEAIYLALAPKGIFWYHSRTKERACAIDHPVATPEGE